MIYGVGTDIVEVARVAKSLARFGERFARRILCEAELAQFRAHRQPSHFLAKRFAAKEAFSKALGSGIRAPATWHAIRVENQATGRPVLGFSDALSAHLREKGVGGAHVSLTDERDLAMATVILECAT